jgi:exopolyphosphatase/guanosine-5'-triphosphate,3'-diphosphate pyrophosphatase
VKNGDLRGFSPLEVETIALVARYHRRGHPRKRHAAFGALPKRERRLVRVLAGMLRVADALDRSHRQVVKTLRVSERDGVLKLRGEAFGNSDLERWGVGRRTELLAHALGRPLRAEVVPAAAPLRRARA